MPSDPQMPAFKDNPSAGSAPPALPAVQPPVNDAPPPLVGRFPPPLPPKAPHKSPSARQLLAILLSVFLALFVADAVVSLVDDSLILCFGIHLLAGIRGMLFFFATLMAILVYGLMGLTPMIPKRQFLPLTLFTLVVQLVAIPCLIFFYGRFQEVSWGFSCCQVIFGLILLYWIQGGLKFRWPLVAEAQLGVRRFGWWNLGVFLILNVFVLLPAILFHLVFCARLAVDHFSDGFVTLRRAGLTVQTRKYVRHDGKTIQLVPMAHIGDADFYRKLSHSFPTNSIILMEGVTDNRNLLTNKLSYKRSASSLGLAEQQKEFKPSGGRLVQADVDVEQFTTNTIDLLNLATLVHAKGLNADTVLQLMQYSPPPHFEEQLFDDLLKKRNRHLLGEIQTQLAQSETLIVPWGAAHMPGLAEEIKKSGFRLDEVRDYVVIRFRGRGDQSKDPRPGGDQGKVRALP